MVGQGKETPLSDMTLKYPLAETRPELMKSKIGDAEQVLSLRLRQLASTAGDYEEQIALAAALRYLKSLKNSRLTQ